MLHLKTSVLFSVVDLQQYNTLFTYSFTLWKTAGVEVVVKTQLVRDITKYRPCVFA